MENKKEEKEVCNRRKHLELRIHVVGFGINDRNAFEEFLEFGLDNYNIQSLFRNAEYDVYDAEPCEEDDCEICFPDEEE